MRLRESFVNFISYNFAGVIKKTSRSIQNITLQNLALEIFRCHPSDYIDNSLPYQIFLFHIRVYYNTAHILFSQSSETLAKQLREIVSDSQNSDKNPF